MDETLAGLAYPEVADPVGYEQAAASFRSMMRMSDKQWQSMVVEGEIDGIAEFNSVTFDRLSGALGRLVLEPARNTIANNIAPGTRFARVPEPGACVWCLMLASRGAVYSRETVGAVNKYHDGCRCLGIEVKRDGSDLPRINRDLEREWDRLTETLDRTPALADFRQHIHQLKELKKWPELKEVHVPAYKGNGMSRAFPGEPLPSDLNRLVGHVLYGWRDKARKGEKNYPHTENIRMGHTWDTMRPGVSKFPESWSNQDIANAIVDTLENPTHRTSGPIRRVVWKSFDDLVIQVRYNVLRNGKVTVDTAFPETELPREASVIEL